MDKAMQMNTSYRKGRDGWRGETDIVLGDATDTMGRAGKRVLSINTYKFSGGLGTFASVHIEAGGMTSFLIGGDFHKRMFQGEGVRCTEAAVKKQHSSCVDEPARLRDIVFLARKHYEAKDAAAALNAKRDAELAARDAQQSSSQFDETAHFRAA